MPPAPRQRRRPLQRGLSLIELMVTMAITMLTVLAIVSVMATHGRQQRLGGSVARVQNEAMIALALIERDLQQAGYGLANDRLQGCAAVNSNVDGAPIDGLSTAAVTIVDGGGGAPDSLRIRFAESLRGDSPLTLATSMGNAKDDLAVASSYGVRTGDLLLLADAALRCTLVQVTQIVDSTTPHKLKTQNRPSPNFNPNNPPAGWPVYTTAGDTRIYVLGTLTQRLYRVSTTNRWLESQELLETAATPIVETIVNLQAQYGITASAASDTVTAWVDATGSWATPSVADRKRIKAVRFAVVARSDEVDRSLNSAGGIEIWPAVAAGAGQTSPAVTYTPSSADRQHRHRVLRAVVPLRNLMWAELT